MWPDGLNSPTVLVFMASFMLGLVVRQNPGFWPHAFAFTLPGSVFTVKNFLTYCDVNTLLGPSSCWSTNSSGIGKRIVCIFVELRGINLMDLLILTDSTLLSLTFFCLLSIMTFSAFYSWCLNCLYLIWLSI